MAADELGDATEHVGASLGCHVDTFVSHRTLHSQAAIDNPIYPNRYINCGGTKTKGGTTVRKTLAVMFIVLGIAASIPAVLPGVVCSSGTYCGI